VHAINELSNGLAGFEGSNLTNGPMVIRAADKETFSAPINILIHRV
jgi:hypothetical protein